MRVVWTAERCSVQTTQQTTLWYKWWPQQTQRADICNNKLGLATCVRCQKAQPWTGSHCTFSAEERTSRWRDLSSSLRSVAKKPIVVVSSSASALPRHVAMWVVISASEESRDGGFITRREMTRHFVIWCQETVSRVIWGRRMALSTHCKLWVIISSYIGHFWVRPQSAWHLSSAINLSGWVEKYFRIPTVLQISSYLPQFTHLHLEMWPKNEFSEKDLNF